MISKLKIENRNAKRTLPKFFENMEPKHYLILKLFLNCYFFSQMFALSLKTNVKK